MLMIIACAMGAHAQTVLTGVLSSGNSMTLLEDECYILRDYFVVEDDATLNIEEGVIIRAESGAGLLIEPGGIINATGAPNNPVIFTTDQSDGSRTPGYWDGVIIAGDAQTNDGSIALPNTTATAGGMNNNSNSGTLSNVQIHFAGGNSTPLFDAALTLVCVGSGTVIENVQVTYSARNNINIVGGAPELKYMVTMDPRGNQAYITRGAIPKIQFLLSLRTDDGVTPLATANGILIENVENNTNNYENTPLTNPVVSNATILDVSKCHEEDAFGNSIVYRNNGAGSIFNTVVGEMQNTFTGLFIDGNQSINHTATNLINFSANDFFNISSGTEFDWNGIWSTAPGCPLSMQQWLDGSGSGGCTELDNNFGLADLGYDESICSVCPLQASLNFVINPISTEVGDTNYASFPQLSDAFFVKTYEYRGAIQTTDLYSAWIEYCPNGAEYVACEEAKLKRDNSLGINYDRKTSSISVYPNPVHNDMMIQASGFPGNLSAVIVDITGRKVSEAAVSGNGATKVSLNALQPGTYFIRMMSDGAVQQVVKVTKY